MSGEPGEESRSRTQEKNISKDRKIWNNLVHSEEGKWDGREMAREDDGMEEVRGDQVWGP